MVVKHLNVRENYKYYIKILLGIENIQKKINQDSDADTPECWGGRIYEDGAQIYENIRGVAILICG